MNSLCEFLQICCYFYFIFIPGSSVGIGMCVIIMCILKKQFTQILIFV